jgi:hypothetical protein
MGVLETLIEQRNADLLAAMGPANYAHYCEGKLQALADAHAAHVATMDIAPEIVLWAGAMRQKFGTSYVRIGGMEYVADWVTALLFMRYGGEPRAFDAAEVAAAKAEGREPNCSTDPSFAGWPSAFSEQDIKRAGELLVLQKFPAFFTPLVVEK